MTQPLRARPTLIAPGWHTIVVVLALMALSAWGAFSHGLPGFGPSGRALRYVTTMVCEWLLVALVWRGIRLRGATLRSLLGDRWATHGSLLRDIGITMVFLLVANAMLGLYSWALHAAPSPTMRDMAPGGPLEIVLWMLLSATAGICEEIIFRGYLQAQAAALLNSAAAGAIIQGVLFGASHGYQSPKVMVMIALFGCLFGVLAQWRHSLRPGMIAHVLQDGVGGLVMRQIRG